MRRGFRERPRLAGLLVLGVVALVGVGFAVGLLASGGEEPEAAPPRSQSEVSRELRAARDEARRSAREARELLTTAQVSRRRALANQRRTIRRLRSRAAGAERRARTLQRALTRARRNQGTGNQGSGNQGDG